MKPQKPLEFEEIAEYLEQPEAPGNADIRRRLLESEVSRRRTDLTTRVQTLLREDPQSVVSQTGDDSSLTAELRTELEALRTGQLDDKQSARLRRRLHDDPSLLREALHYTFTQNATGRVDDSGQPWRTWVAQAFAWRVPVWAAAGATALLVLGPQAGFSLADELQLPAYFVIREKQGFSERYTDAFAEFLVDQS